MAGKKRTVRRESGGRFPTGTQIRLTSGRYAATIVSVGAAIREFRHNERDVFVPFAEDATPHRFHGAILAPWPNRIIDGRYMIDGAFQQLPITEPSRGHALHGLVIWNEFDVTSATDTAATLTTRIVPQPGYPFDVDLRVDYRLNADGLSTAVTARNRSASAAPFGVGAHPWIAVPGGLANAVLTLPAARVQQTRGPRMMPDSVIETPPSLDFRTPRALGHASIDHAFTELTTAADGRTRVEIVDPDGYGARLETGSDLPWIQVCTSDWPDAHQRRAIAIEPMSCPPNSFSTRSDLTWIDPGAAIQWEWRFSALIPTGSPNRA